MATYFDLTLSYLDIDILKNVINSGSKIRLSAAVKQKINGAREFLESLLKNNPSPIYGVNTGFGAMYNISIEESGLSLLQEKMVMSHACGTGEYTPREIVRIMLLLKIISLSKGNSGVRIELVEKLVELYNKDLLPVVYQQGSLGASGDLVPLAHLSLPLIGMGEIWDGNEPADANISLKKNGLAPPGLKAKEGLAMLNGTQFMSATMAACIIKSEHLIKWAEIISAISMDAFQCSLVPFDERIHSLRHHKGQIETASNIRRLLHGSEIQKLEKEHLQDPYSFRCIPQILGATRGVIRHAGDVLNQEINAVTDNPLLFPEDNEILSGGNFHGQALAMAMDYLSIAMHEVGSVSERRIYQLISGKRELPPFLIHQPGLNSGLMITQYLAASIVSQNKQLCTPASADSIESSAGQEDHVSMGANSGTKALRIIDNLEKILAIELFNATQALEFRRPHKTSPFLEDIVRQYRMYVPKVEEDRIFHYDIKRTVNFIRQTDLKDI